MLSSSVRLRRGGGGGGRTNSKKKRWLDINRLQEATIRFAGEASRASGEPAGTVRTKDVSWLHVRPQNACQRGEYSKPLLR